MSKTVIFYKKIGTKEKLSYGIGDMACQFIFGPLGTFILYFWTDVVGIAAATASLMILLSKVWDAINDPLMGAFIDAHDFGNEKIRPYIKYLAIPFGIAAVICFVTPEAPIGIKIAYAFISYNITNMIYTAINIPYGLLPVKMTNDVNERGTLSVVRMTFGMSGYAIITIFVPTFVEILGIFYTFLFLGVAATIMWFIVYFNTKELPRDEESQEEHTIPFKEGAKGLVKNKVWFILAIGMLVYTISQSIMGGTATYYVKYLLEVPEAIPTSVMLTICLLTPALGQIFALIFIINPAFKKYGKVRTTQVSLIFAAICNTLIFILVQPNEVGLLLTLLFLSGIGCGAVMPAIFAMLADSIEYGEYVTGTRIEGLTYAGASLGQKAGSGIGLALTGSILSMSGYIANQSQSVQALFGIKVSYILIPIICYIFFAVILQFNPLDKIYKDVERELIRRKSKRMLEEEIAKRKN